jgi:ribosomal protein S12 methylthiotransferase
MKKTSKLNILPSASNANSLNTHPADGLDQGQTFTGRASIVTLGCAKNQVDSEVMLGVLKQKGFEIVTDVKEADVVVVNTCGFLESSVKESINAVLEVSEYKQTGRLRKLIVAGCAVERYRDQLKESLPEADEFILTGDLLKVADSINAPVHESLVEAGRPYFLYDENMPRHLSTQSHMAYVKISEGCNRPCTFCIIPKIRGTMRSRSIDSIRREVASLGQQGVREINLIAQDLTHFGFDHKQGRLVDLLKALDEDKSVDWIRLLYAYPVGTDEELIDAIMQLPTVVKYIDIPLQHSSEAVLKAMKRPIGKYSPRSIVKMIKDRAPQIQIRTTFIVGFPGETEQDIDDLVDFVSEGHFTNVGVFTYSLEKEAESATFEGHIKKSVKDKRRDRVMKAQQDVVLKFNEQLIGTVQKVLIEGAHEDTDLLLVGRTQWQAPEVDGTVIINDSELAEDSLTPGSIISVKLTEAAGYDLVGTAIKVED